MSEFGKVLEAAGWEKGALGMPFKNYGLTDYTVAHEEGSMILGRSFAKQLTKIKVKDEHQVLRIVAAIEGMDRWQSMESVPENEDAWYEVLVGDPEEGPHMITPAKLDGARWVDDEGELIPHQPYITAWRPYSPANWEVK